MIIIFAFAIGILMIGYAIAYFIISMADNQKKEPTTNLLGVLETVKKHYINFENERDVHNTTLILNLIEGNTQMGSTTLLLSSVKGHYSYYYHDDLIIYVSEYVWAILKELGYNVYNDSADNLIINYDINEKK